MEPTKAKNNPRANVTNNRVIGGTGGVSHQVEAHERAPTIHDTVQRIIRSIAREAGTYVTVEEVMGKCRCKHIVNVRHRAMAEVYLQFPWMSYPQMGRLFGGRDHSTIMSALRKQGVLKPRLQGCSGRNMDARLYGQSIDFLFVRVGAALSASAGKGELHHEPA